VDVGLIGAASVVISAVRVRREQQLGRLTTLAEVAQKAVLPVLPAHARSIDIAVRYESAAEHAVIGGDLYDCYHSRTHTRFLLGDVRGKGIGAVEQAARVIRAFRQAAAIQTDLHAVAEDMSGYLTPFFDEEEFVTAVLLDTTDATRTRLVNAGHPPPLLIHPDGSCEYVETEADLPLGLGDQYTLHEFEWQPGDRLLLYTDGVSEARDRSGEFLDLRALGSVLTGESLELTLDHLLAAVRAHAASGELTDDAAVLLLEYSPAGNEYEPVAGEHDWRSSLLR
jgi:sigma-B regulation protein RsbU (phosphoserine phosphatase)